MQWIAWGSTRHRVRCVAAFTLLEVLVVVAIIALLVAILLPSLGEVRNQAQMVKCAAGLRQGVAGAILYQTEQRMRKERWSTNFGWAVASLRQSKGETDIFQCPADVNPTPIPALFDRQYADSGMASFHGEVGSDAIFNRVWDLGGSVYSLNYQDIVDQSGFGFDAETDTYDARVDITVSAPGQKFAPGVGTKPSAAWTHMMYTFKGRKLGQDGFASTTLPVMWMSYGANASAGLIGVRGSPILAIEAGKPGVFPETLGNFNADVLPQAVRFRHGSRNSRSGFAGQEYMKVAPGTARSATVNLPANRIDGNYIPRTRANAGFLDGHVEAIVWNRLFTDPAYGYPVRKQQPWIGLPRKNPSLTFGPPE